MSFPQTETNNLNKIFSEIEKQTRIICLSGLTSISAKTCILSKLQAKLKKTLVVVSESNLELEVWENDLGFWQELNNSTRNGIFSLPAFENDVYSAISPHAETLERRALAFWNLTKKNPDFLLTSAKALVTKIVSPKEMENLGIKLKRDEDFPPEEVIRKLTACGYVKEEPLKNFGEFSMRGGIIDVWSPDAENPVRIEFFGDTIDSIREFDAETQLSVGQIKEISIAPMREFSATPEDLKDWAFFARERFADEKFFRNLKDRTQFAEEGETFNGWENLFPLVSPRESSVFNYLKDFILVIDEPVQIEQKLTELYEHLENSYRRIEETDDIGLKPEEMFFEVEKLREVLQNSKIIELRALGRLASETDEEFTLNV